MSRTTGYSLVASIPRSPISYAIAVIPEEPLFSQVAEASLAITKLCENRNIIDNERFPCHISLLISGASKSSLLELANLLTEAQINPVPIKAIALRSGRRGFISLEVDKMPLHELQKSILPAVKEILKHEPVIRPHLIERWKDLSREKQELVQRYGSYQVGSDFHPHLSVAAIAPERVDEMMALASKFISVPSEVLPREIQIVDVGHENEKWEIFCRIPLQSASRNQLSKKT